MQNTPSLVLGEAIAGYTIDIVYYNLENLAKVLDLSLFSCGASGAYAGQKKGIPVFITYVDKWGAEGVSFK